MSLCTLIHLQRGLSSSCWLLVPTSSMIGRICNADQMYEWECTPRFRLVHRILFEGMNPLKGIVICHMFSWQKLEWNGIQFHSFAWFIYKWNFFFNVYLLKYISKERNGIEFHPFGNQKGLIMESYIPNLSNFIHKPNTPLNIL